MGLKQTWVDVIMHGDLDSVMDCWQTCSDVFVKELTKGGVDFQ